MLSLQTVLPDTLELLRVLMQQPLLKDMRLVGGTSLALQYGHRRSVDLDFFGTTTEDIDELTKMMQDYQNQLKSENGVGDKELDKLIEDMQKTEKELVNRTLSDQTIIRQKTIETRLLESEKADRKQEDLPRQDPVLPGKDCRRKTR